MRILVTGGAGFIGSHVVDACVEAGHQVVVVDDLSSGSRANLNARTRWYRVDVRSDDLDRVFDAERPDVVSHHAAQVSVRRSTEAPELDASVNVLGSLRLLEAARRYGVRRVVFASTGGAIYGEVDGTPADETRPCRPLSPYAVAKLAVEHYLESYRAMHALEAIVLRYANVYGPRQDPHGEAGVVAIFTRHILGDRPPVIFGDGEQIRDFVYVEDVARAHLAALAVSVGDRVPIYNIASGREVSVNTLWERLAALSGTRLTPRHAAPRTGDLRRSVLDPSRAKRELAWAADVDLDDGLRRTWEWFRLGAQEQPRAA